MEYEGKSKGFKRLISVHNPFFLMSALCMLAGYFTLTNALAQKAGRIIDLVLLLGILNIYEFLIIGLGIYLALRKKVFQDSIILLIIGLFFLFDATFINVEVFTANPVWGGVIHGFILVLGLLKGGAILWLCMKNFRSIRYIVYLAIEYIIFLAIPGIFAVLSRSSNLGEWTMYGIWWVFGIMIAVKGFLAQENSRKVKEDGLGRIENILSWGLIIVPTFSFLIHLCASNWVHSVPFYVGNIAPVLLGTSVFLNTALKNVIPQKISRILFFVLPGIALCLSVYFPETLQTGADYQTFSVFTPFRILLYGAAILFGSGVFMYRSKLDAVVGAGSLVTGGTGASLKAVIQNIWKLLPSTAIQWGVLIIFIAFLLFGAGAFVSLRKQPEKSNH